MTMFRLAVLAACLSVAAGASAVAQNWPERPVTITVAFAAGGSGDTMVRTLAGPLGAALGQPVIVENRPGAGGGLAVAALKTQRADGYNIVATTLTVVTFDPHVSQLTFAMDDFTYIAAVGEFQEAFIAVPSRPWKNFGDLLADAKRKPLNFGSSTQIDRVVAAAIGKASGAQLIAVPSRGGAEVLTAVLGGHVDFGYSAGFHYPHVKAGKLMVLASLGEARLRAFPEVPTLRELGFNAFSINYLIILAPKNVSAQARAKLDAAFAKAVKDPPFVELVAEKLNLGPQHIGTGELESVLRKHSEGYKEMIAAAPKSG